MCVQMRDSAKSARYLTLQVLRPVFHSPKQDACQVKDPLTGNCDGAKRQHIPSEINWNDDVDVKDTLH